jgi:subtilase family serine protease
MCPLPNPYPSVRRGGPFLPRLVTALSIIVLVSLLTLSAQAADPLIQISADKMTVSAGDKDTLHIRLHNVNNATLNGDPLKGNKIDRKVTVNATTTYTVDATDKDGKPVTQSLTVSVKGSAPAAVTPAPANTNQALSPGSPDLIVESISFFDAPIPYTNGRIINIVETLKNRGDASTLQTQVNEYKDGQWVSSFTAPSIDPGKSYAHTYIVTGNQGVEIIWSLAWKADDSPQTGPAKNIQFAATHIPQ